MAAVNGLAMFGNQSNALHNQVLQDQTITSRNWKEVGMGVAICLLFLGLIWLAYAAPWKSTIQYLQPPAAVTPPVVTPPTQAVPIVVQPTPVAPTPPATTAPAASTTPAPAAPATAPAQSPPTSSAPPSAPVAGVSGAVAKKGCVNGLDLDAMDRAKQKGVKNPDGSPVRIVCI